MVISHKYKFIFIHIPKCAGTSIMDSLLRLHGGEEYWNEIDPKDAIRFSVHPDYGNYEDENLSQHSNCRDTEKFFLKKGWDFSKYFKFAFVRNPWSRQLSKFSYTKSEADKYLKSGEEFRSWAVDFERGGIPPHFSFENYCEKEYCKSIFKGVETQLQYISREDGSWMVDYVGKLERINDNFYTACKKAGMPYIKPDHHNQTVKKPYYDSYDHYTKELVGATYLKDIMGLNYAFKQ